MRQFLLELLPWCIAAVSMVCALMSYLMYVRAHELAKKMHGHWRESHELNVTACGYIRQLEDELKRSLDQDESEHWKNL